MNDINKNKVIPIDDYELSDYYLGNKPQHRGHDEDDPYSGEYRVAILKMSDGSTQYGLWCDGNLYGDHFPTEDAAMEALEADWECDKDELEAQHADDGEVDGDDDEEEAPNPACFADIPECEPQSAMIQK